MDISQYLDEWEPEELAKFSHDKLAELGIDNNTAIFLSETGLPKDVAPFLSFGSYELETVHSGWQTNNDEDKFLIIIGSDGSGDPICVDASDNCKVIILDHDDGLEASLINSSVKQLFAFLTIYKRFGEELINLRGEDAFLDADCTDQEMDELKSELTSVDAKALSEKRSFWNIELNCFIETRDEQ